MDSLFWIIETMPMTKWVIARPRSTEMSTLMYSKLPMCLYEPVKMLQITGFSRERISLRSYSGSKGNQSSWLISGFGRLQPIGKNRRYLTATMPT